MSITDQPKTSTIKRLFAVSGNNCAFSKCSNKLVEGEKVTGRICHIKARSDGGPRYDPNQSNEERRGFNNLILMCPIHHDVIDSDEKSYTVERLLDLKKKHEEANNHLNKDEVSMEVVNQLVINMDIETKIKIKNEYQNNGQLADVIVNYIVPDIPIKSKKVSCRILLTNIENSIKELKERQEVPRGIVMSPIYLSSKWEKLYEDISDYLDINDSATLLTFYEKVVSFNGFLKDAEEYFQTNKLQMGLPMLDYGVNNISRVYEGYINTILNIDLDNLMERLKVLAT